MSNGSFSLLLENILKVLCNAAIIPTKFFAGTLSSNICASPIGVSCDSSLPSGLPYILSDSLIAFLVSCTKSISAFISFCLFSWLINWMYLSKNSLDHPLHSFLLTSSWVHLKFICIESPSKSAPQFLLTCAGIVILDVGESPIWSWKSLTTKAELLTFPWAGTLVPINRSPTLIPCFFKYPGTIASEATTFSSPLNNPFLYDCNPIPKLADW